MDKLINAFIGLIEKMQPEQVVLMMMGFIIVFALYVVLEIAKLHVK